MTLPNAIVMNKYIWMCRQLRNFNDAMSIVYWANATMHVKALLLDDEHAARARLHSSAMINQQRYDPACSITSPTTICFPPTPNKRPPATNNKQGKDPDRSLTPPTTISFQPTPKQGCSAQAQCRVLKSAIWKFGFLSRPCVSLLNIFYLCVRYQQIFDGETKIITVDMHHT